MKKTLIFALIAILILLLAACSCYSENTVDPYNTAVREGWDIYATLNCFVKTEYNKDGNPIVRSLYSTETWENGLTVYYQYDKDGYLCELSMDGKSVGGSYFKNLRFDLSFGEDNLTQTGRPLHGSQAYERVSFTWDENRKLVSEFAKPSFISDFTYDEKGGITKEHYSESEKDSDNNNLKHGGVCQRSNCIRGEYIHYCINKAGSFGCGIAQFLLRYHITGTDLHDIGKQQAKGNRHGGGDNIENNCAKTDGTNFFDIMQRYYALNDGQQDHGNNYHLNKIQINRSDRLYILYGNIRMILQKQTQYNTQNKTYRDFNCQRQLFLCFFH